METTIRNARQVYEQATGLQAQRAPRRIERLCRFASENGGLDAVEIRTIRAYGQQAHREAVALGGCILGYTNDNGGGHYAEFVVAVTR